MKNTYTQSSVSQLRSQSGIHLATSIFEMLAPDSQKQDKFRSILGFMADPIYLSACLIERRVSR